MFVSIDLYFTYRIDKQNKEYEKRKNARATKKRFRQSI